MTLKTITIIRVIPIELSSPVCVCVCVCMCVCVCVCVCVKERVLQLRVMIGRQVSFIHHGKFTSPVTSQTVGMPTGPHFLYRYIRQDCDGLQAFTGIRDREVCVCGCGRWGVRVRVWS